MNYYQQQKLQHFWQNHYQNSTHNFHQMHSIVTIHPLFFTVISYNISPTKKESFIVKFQSEIFEQLCKSQTKSDHLQFWSCNCFVLQLKGCYLLLNCITVLCTKYFMLVKKSPCNGKSLDLYTTVDFQLGYF